MSNVCVLCVKPLIKHSTPRISLHVFPACPKKRQIWLDQCKLTNDKVLPNRKICSFHFEPTCYKPDVKRRTLYPDAVPTIFAKGHVKNKNLTLKIVKGRIKSYNNKRIASQNIQSHDVSSTKSTKKNKAGSNRVACDISPTKPGKKVLQRVKSTATNRKRKLDKASETISDHKTKKISFMSLLKLVKIQISLANNVK